MIAEPKIYLKLLSELLQYPDDDFTRRLPEIETVVADLPDGGRKKDFQDAIGKINAHSAMALQETYTAAFDLAPETTLNMAYHLYGDNEKHATALVRLQQVYDDAGYEAATGELPDFLPLMLEFLAISPEVTANAVVWDAMSGLDALINRMPPAVAPYTDILKLLKAIRNGYLTSTTAKGDPAAANSNSLTA